MLIQFYKKWIELSSVTCVTNKIVIKKKYHLNSSQNLSPKLLQKKTQLILLKYIIK